MDSLKQLIIRACKSTNPDMRLRQLYRRFYGNVPRGEESRFIAGILSNICDEYTPIKTASMVDDLNPHNRWKFGISEEESYLDGVVKVLACHIRLTKKDKFPGLTPPAPFRAKSRPKDERCAIPLIVDDEDEIWQVVGAVDQYLNDGLGGDAAQSISDSLFYQRTGDGFLEISLKSDADCLLKSLSHCKDKLGFHGYDWSFQPDGNMIRALIAKLTSTFDASNEQVA